MAGPSPRHQPRWHREPSPRPGRGYGRRPGRARRARPWPRPAAAIGQVARRRGQFDWRRLPCEVNWEPGSLWPRCSHPRGPVPGNGPAPFTGVGASRAQKKVVRCSVWKSLACGLSAAAAIVTTVAAGPASASTVAASPRATGTPQPALTLVSQTNWVTATHPTFDLVLAAGPGTPSASQLGVTIAVYPCLG